MQKFAVTIYSQFPFFFFLKHLQLLTQINLMAREDESLHKEAELTCEYVNELKSFQDRASNAQLIRGLGDGVVHNSAFTFSGLEEAVE